MNKHLSAFILITSLLAVGATSANAQVIPSPYQFVETGKEWGASVGWAWTDPGHQDLGPKSGEVVSARFGAGFGSSLGVEVGSSLLFSSRDVFDPRRDSGDEFIGEAQINVATFDLRLRLNLTGHRTWHRLQPFIVMGGGVAFEALQDRTLETAAGFLPADVYSFGTQFMATAGAGMNLFVTKSLVLRVDGLLHFWKITTPAGFLDATRDIPLDRTRIEPDQWVTHKPVSIGLAWRR